MGKYHASTTNKIFFATSLILAIAAVAMPFVQNDQDNQDQVKETTVSHELTLTQNNDTPDPAKTSDSQGTTTNTTDTTATATTATTNDTAELGTSQTASTLVEDKAVETTATPAPSTVSKETTPATAITSSTTTTTKTNTTEATAATATANSSTNSNNSTAKESVNQEPNSLQERVNKMLNQRSEEQKQAYQQSLEERKEQVEAAIATITEHSKIYLPPALSSQAIVVYFGVTPHAPNKEELAELKKAGLVDALSGPSFVKDEENDIAEPALKYIATYISHESGARLYNILTTTTYPRNLRQLYDFAIKEKSEHILPELTDDDPLDLKDYETVYLCYQNWWDDIPMAVYSFLEKYDLSGKTVIPVCLHSGGGFAKSTATLAALEPNATVYHDGLLINRTELTTTGTAKQHIRSFLTDIRDLFN